MTGTGDLLVGAEPRTPTRRDLLAGGVSVTGTLATERLATGFLALGFGLGLGEESFLGEGEAVFLGEGEAEVGRGLFFDPPATPLPLPLFSFSENKSP